MKRILLIALLCISTLLHAQVDSTSLSKLSSMLEEYYEAMLFEDNSVKEEECDYLIETCTDSLLRSFVANSILEHYMNEPKLMGEEAVAIYLYEKWFLSGKVKPADDWKAMEADIFYRFNRQSMIGLPAPSLQLYDSQGLIHTVPEGKACVLLFYEPSCSKCQLLLASLPSVLSSLQAPLLFYAVNTGADEEAWAEMREKFCIDNPAVSLVHLWDPEVESDYQFKYGVTSTPKMFFIDASAIIEGRRLEIESLRQILQIYELYYGQIKSEK